MSKVQTPDGDNKISPCSHIDVVKLFEKYKLMIFNSFSLDGKVALVTGTSDFVNGQILYVDGGILAYISKQLK